MRAARRDSGLAAISIQSHYPVASLQTARDLSRLCFFPRLMRAARRDSGLAAISSNPTTLSLRSKPPEIILAFAFFRA
jgi:hypothetical protein